MIEVYVNHADRLGVSDAAVERAVRLVLSADSVAQAEVSVTFLPDHEMQRLNQSYLAHDWATDVLAFALDDMDSEAGEGGRLLGDVYVGWERAAEQAGERGIAVLEEVVRLAIHGTLHLLGRDHPEGPDREQSAFFAEQEAWVSRALALVGDDE